MQRRQIISCVCPVDALDEEQLCAGPEGVFLAGGGGGAYFLVSRMELATEVSGAALGHAGLEDVHGVHDEDRAAEKLVRSNACQFSTSCSALQSRWNK